MTEPLTYNIEEAAAKLGTAFTPDWLKHHINELPHGRTGTGTGRGGRIFFDADDLTEIVRRHKKNVAPDPQPARVGPVSRRRAS
jgi:hypothetical protein